MSAPSAGKGREGKGRNTESACCDPLHGGTSSRLQMSSVDPRIYLRSTDTVIA